MLTVRPMLALWALLHAACRPAEPPSGWNVTLDGAGPVTFGATVAEASAALKLQPAAPDSAPCYYWKPEGAPAGLRLMIESGKVVRAEVDSPGVATPQGIRVGSRLDSATAALGPGVAVTPHKYEYETGWRYLTLMSPDSSRALVLEADSHTIQSWRAGLWPAAGYVEGCG